MEEDNFLNTIATNKDEFARDRCYFKEFLAKMNIIFMLQPDRFTNDPVKVAYFISRLYGSSMNWAATLIKKINNYQEFTARFKTTMTQLLLPIKN